MMFRANMLMRDKAPPANTSNMPRMPRLWVSMMSAMTTGSIPGNVMNVPARKMKSAPRGEPYAALQFGRLREGREVNIGGQLFRSRSHRRLQYPAVFKENEAPWKTARLRCHFLSVANSSGSPESHRSLVLVGYPAAFAALRAAFLVGALRPFRGFAALAAAFSASSIFTEPPAFSTAAKADFEA